MVRRCGRRSAVDDPRRRGVRRQSWKEAADQRPRDQRSPARRAREGHRAARRQCLVFVDPPTESICGSRARDNPQQRHGSARAALAAVSAISGHHDGPRERGRHPVRRAGDRRHETALEWVDGSGQLHPVETIRAGRDGRRRDHDQHQPKHQCRLLEQRIRREALAIHQWR